MIHRIPSGTRDVLPDEMRELRALTDRLRAVFDRAGYGEVSTPALEYEDTLARAGVAATQPAYRMFDEQGNVLVLRSDMTVPIARLVASRYAAAETPLRFSYTAYAYRGVRPQRGQSREFLQAGVELIGSPAPEGTAEALTVLCAALDAAGLRTYRIGVGDASLYPALLGALGVPEPEQRAAAGRARDRRLRQRSSARSQALELGPEQRALLLRVPHVRGGPEVLDELDAPLHDAVVGLRAVHERLPPEVAGRILFDFGLVRSLGYYTGAVFQVYDPAHGVPLGSGGRYDDLLGRFGRPAAGGGVRAERRAPAHRAGRRGAGGGPVSSELRIAVPRGALFTETLDLLDRVGIDTAEVRGNDRKLLFEGSGIVTMRPSDVPTYVEAGAADIGITGKDVLMEQSEREVYELADLGYGGCTMVLASVAGEDRGAEALRRLGVVRIATKYPKIAARHFLATGRQAEIVEVKGSVELAPLTGLAEAIVDLTATGTTLRENGLVVREEIAHCTARLIANRVAHKLKAAEIDALLERLGALRD